MAFWNRWFGASARPAQPATRPFNEAKMARFVASRRGCEAYIEPPGNHDGQTLLLVAASGEWTRCPLPDARDAVEFARHRGIGLYHVNLVGYPDSMRRWNSANRQF